MGCVFAFFEALGMKDSGHMQGFPGRIALVCSDSLDKTSQCVTNMRSRQCLKQSVLGISSWLFLSHCSVGTMPCPARRSCSCTRLNPRRWRWHHRGARRVAAASPDALPPCRKAHLLAERRRNQWPRPQTKREQRPSKRATAWMLPGAREEATSSPS